MTGNYSNRSPKTFKSIICFLFSLLILLGFRTLSNDKPDISKYINPSPAEIPEINKPYSQTEAPVSSKDASFSALESGNRYAALSESQKRIYKSLQQAVAKRASFINIEYDLVQEKDFNAVWNAFVYTDPYLLATGVLENASYRIDSRNIVHAVNLEYNLDEKTMQKYYQSTLEMVQKIAADANGMNDRDKAKYFHDYLILHSSYSTMPDDKTVHSAYGCLVNGYCVCEGYARAYKLLCDEAQIPCEIVLGQVDNINHAWNLIQLNGTWSHVDVTFDDPVGAPENYVGNQFFCLTTAEISKDHIIDPEENFPMP